MAMWNYCERLEGFLWTNHNLGIKEFFCYCLIATLNLAASIVYEGFEIRKIPDINTVELEFFTT